MLQRGWVGLMGVKWARTRDIAVNIGQRKAGVFSGKLARSVVGSIMV